MLKKDTIAPDFTGETFSQETFKLSQVKSPTIHLAFHRYASCPICNLSLREYMNRFEEIKSQGISYVAIFHSPLKKMQEYYEGRLPFTVVLDPQMKLYKLYKTKSSLLGFLSPASGLQLAKSMKTNFKKAFSADGDNYTMPADFLIQDGKIVELKYGKFIGDSWSVDQMLELAR